MNWPPDMSFLHSLHYILNLGHSPVMCVTVRRPFLKKTPKNGSPGFELTNRDSGNTLFIFHDTVFPTYPENHDTKEGFCFLNRGIKIKFFLAFKGKNDFNIMRISFLLKQLCWCCLDIRFFSLILLGVSFCNSFQLYVLFLSVQWSTEDCHTITERYFKSVYY